MTPEQALWVFLVAVAVLFNVGYMWSYFQTPTAPRLNPQPPSGRSGGSDAQPEYTLTQADRDMVYQTPKWWDQEFHKALEASSTTPRILVDTDLIETRTYNGIDFIRVEYTYLADCTCSACATVRSMA
jgi:hypothetical protein